MQASFYFFFHKTKIWDTSRYIFYKKHFWWWLRALRAKKLICCKNHKIAFSACSACTFCKIFKISFFYDIYYSEFNFLGIWISILDFFPSGASCLRPPKYARKMLFWMLLWAILCFFWKLADFKMSYRSEFWFSYQNKKNLNTWDIFLDAHNFLRALHALRAKKLKKLPK